MVTVWFIGSILSFLSTLSCLFMTMIRVYTVVIYHVKCFGYQFRRTYHEQQQSTHRNQPARFERCHAGSHDGLACLRHNHVYRGAELFDYRRRAVRGERGSKGPFACTATTTSATHTAGALGAAHGGSGYPTACTDATTGGRATRDEIGESAIIGKREDA